jgi:hypothetical protein
MIPPVHLWSCQCVRDPRPARVLWLVPGGGVEPPRAEARRILRASKLIALQCPQLLLSASDAVSVNIELLPVPFQMYRLRPVPVTTASQAVNPSQLSARTDLYLDTVRGLGFEPPHALPFISLNLLRGERQSLRIFDPTCHHLPSKPRVFQPWCAAAQESVGCRSRGW